MMSMSDRMRVVGVAAVCGLGMLAGCGKTPERLNAPPQGSSCRPHELQDPYTYMNDNALLAEMSMSPAHFVPNRPDLNALGLRRMTRYAELLKEYGGTLNYDGVNDPEKLARERQERITAFLVSAGVDPGAFKVARGTAGGQGLRADEAMAIREASTFSAAQQVRQGQGGNWRNESIDGGDK